MPRRQFGHIIRARLWKDCDLRPPRGLEICGPGLGPIVPPRPWAHLSVLSAPPQPVLDAVDLVLADVRQGFGLLDPQCLTLRLAPGALSPAPRNPRGRASRNGCLAA